MKIRLEATPEELRERADELVTQLSKALRAHAPEVAERLEKASSPKEVELRHRALRDMHQRAQKLYQMQMDRMIDDIGQALERRIKTLGAVEKGDPNYLSNVIDMAEANYDKIKAELTEFGYHDHEYEEGGALYGHSANQLRDILEQLRKQGAPNGTADS